MRAPARFLAGALLLATPLGLASAQSHVYRLNGTLADLYGGPSLVAAGGVLSATGYTFGTNQGLSLSNVLSAGTSYSVVIRSEYTAESAYGTGWRKMVDFADRSSDYGYYDRSGLADFYPIGTGGTPYANNVMAFTVLTRDASTKLFNAYVNGAQALTFTDNGGIADFTGAGGIARFFEDDVPSRQVENAPGFVDYIAVYDRALTAPEVAVLTPVTATPEPASLALLGSGLVGIAAFARRRSR